MRGIALEGSPPATSGPHGLANSLRLAHTCLEDFVVDVVGDVIQLVIPWSRDAPVFAVEVVLRETGVGHDWLPLRPVQCAHNPHHCWLPMPQWRISL